LQQLAFRFTNDRTKAGAKVKDMYYYFVRQSSEFYLTNHTHRTQTEDEVASQSPATTDEILADGMLAIIAGADTTSTMLGHVFYYLLRHPECAVRLQQEIDAMFPAGEDPMDFARLADMPYLTACMLVCRLPTAMI
jgi:cytochrome P450